MLVSAFAKLNLCLEILGKRGDGYHEVRTVLQAIDLADCIEIRPASELNVRCSAPGLEGQSNLAWRAAMDLAKHSRRIPMADISIEKRIPTGMGLGGGSSDAAAVLLALNDLWDLKLPLAQLAGIAAGLGSDVPYFLWGGAALAGGRGEDVQPLPSRPGLPVTLICPAETLEAKTAHLYGKLQPQNFSDGGVVQHLIQNIMSGHYPDDMFCNAFESVAMQEFPGLKDVHRIVAQVTGRRPHLTGAGPALFLLPSSEAEYGRVCEALPSELAQAYFVRTMGRGAPLAPVAGE